MAEAVQPQTSRALRISRSLALIVFGGLATILMIVALATLLPNPDVTFPMTKEVAFARIQGGFPLAADDRLAAPITANGQTFYAIAYNDGAPGEVLRIFVAGDHVAQLQLRFESYAAVTTAHGESVIPLLKAVEPSLTVDQLTGASSAVESIIRESGRGSVTVGGERVVVAAAWTSIIITVMPLGAPDPLAPK